MAPKRNTATFSRTGRLDMFSETAILTTNVLCSFSYWLINPCTVIFYFFLLWLSGVVFCVVFSLLYWGEDDQDLAECDTTLLLCSFLFWAGPAGTCLLMHGVPLCSWVFSKYLHVTFLHVRSKV